MPVLRDLQALVKGFHPNTAADSSRQVFKKPPRSKSGTDQLQKTLRYLAFPTLCVGLEAQPASYHSYRKVRAVGVLDRVQVCDGGCGDFLLFLEKLCDVLA
eukprot:COSAG01_NODE_26370_length_716_cov_0.782820_1_plen_100_part_10